VSPTLQKRFPSAAEAAIEHILQKEESRLKELKPESVWIASDSLGQLGDVRDVVLKGANGEFGISCKTNHDAFKHPRLSGRADFVKRWGLDSKGCSDEYWQNVRPIFTELGNIRTDSGQKALWEDLQDVPTRFYWPILDAFKKEVLRIGRADAENSDEVARSLIKYIIGNQDFYKVIARTDLVEIQGFNLHGTLGLNKTKFPDHILSIDRFDGGQFSETIRFNRGYSFNFRLHSASKRVEPSLKFDVTAVALPPAEIYTNHISLTN